MNTQENREVTIYATRGGNMKKVTTNVTTWRELKDIVRREGFDVDNLLAAENVTKGDLINPEAILPTSSFRLFLRPAQTKSGNVPDRKECFAIIREHITAYPEDKHKFIIDGKNMTQLSTPVVQDLVAKYCKMAKGGTAEEVAEVVEETQEETTRIAEESVEVGISDITNAQRVQEALFMISSLKGFKAYKKAKKQLGKLLIEVDPSLKPEETEEESLAREAKQFSNY